MGFWSLQLVAAAGFFRYVKPIPFVFGRFRNMVSSYLPLYMGLELPLL